MFHCCQRQRWGPLLNVLLCITIFISPVLGVWSFGTQRFTGDSLIDAGLRGVDLNQRVIAFGDFNGDQFLDLLALGDDQQTLSVYLWNHEKYTFKRSSTFRHPRKVVNAVPGDFTHSGKLDVLIMSDAGSELSMSLYPANIGGGFDVNNPITIPSSTETQPIPIDLNGDMKIDLLGMTPSSRSSQNPLRAWQNVWNSSNPNSELFSIDPPNFNGQQCVLANPHSNAVVDFDGDCLADLFLLCDNGGGRKSYQIWINNKDTGFYLSQGGSLPTDVQSVSFADVNRDGTIDMVFTTCSRVSSKTGLGQDCYINIAYNQQLPLCGKNASPSKNQCRAPDALCVADRTFHFDLTESESNHGFVKFSVASLFPSEHPPPLLMVQDTSSTPPIPQAIKLGDADLDGFPDMLFITGSSRGKENRPRLVYSVPCKGGRSLVGCTGEARRGWMEKMKGTEVLGTIKDARSASFLDMDEDGTLDIMVQRTGASGNGNILFVQNNFYYDAFFMKAIVLNGACGNGWCHSPNGSVQYHPFGVSYSGASYKYTILDTVGSRSAAQIGQLPQTSYHSLLTPYSFFGLGRTNNYIENLFVGSTIHAPQHFINMEGVIPNSKVVILPPASEGGSWRKELYLRPGRWIPWVTVTVVVGMLIFAIIILVLHLNEKREDESERRRALHHINFDAL